MIFEIFDFKQQAIIDLDLTLEELSIIRWFRDYRGVRGKEYCPQEEEFYYVFYYEDLKKDLPLLFTRCTTEESRQKKAQRLLSGNLTKIIKKKITRDREGTHIYLRFTENYGKLLTY